MSRFESPLNDIKVASPCPADWNEMYGDDRKRFCGECKLNVYNLSGMTRHEAEILLQNSEGRLCVRFYRRADGSVITRDCPVGWARVKQRTLMLATATASLLMALFTGVLFSSFFSMQTATAGKLIPFVTPTPEPLMGDIAAPPKNDNSNLEMGERSTIMGNIAMPQVQSKPPKTKFDIGKMKVMRVGTGARRDS